MIMLHDINRPGLALVHGLRPCGSCRHWKDGEHQGFGQRSGQGADVFTVFFFVRFHLPVFFSFTFFFLNLFSVFCLVRPGHGLSFWSFFGVVLFFLLFCDGFMLFLYVLLMFQSCFFVFFCFYSDDVLSLLVLCFMMVVSVFLCFNFMMVLWWFSVAFFFWFSGFPFFLWQFYLFWLQYFFCWQVWNDNACSFKPWLVGLKKVWMVFHSKHGMINLRTELFQLAKLTNPTFSVVFERLRAVFLGDAGKW